MEESISDRESEEESSADGGANDTEDYMSDDEALERRPKRRKWISALTPPATGQGALESDSDSGERDSENLLDFGAMKRAYFE